MAQVLAKTDGSYAENEMSLAILKIRKQIEIFVFGDLITEVLSCIRDWRETSAGSVYTDH